MNPFVASAIYKDPWVGALDNGSTWGDLGRKKGNVTVVDLYVKIDERLVLPDEFNLSFHSYAFRPISVRSAVKADGTPVEDNEIYPYLGVDQPGDPAGYGVLARIQANNPSTTFRTKSYLLNAANEKVPVYNYVIRTRVRTGYDSYGNKITPATMEQIQSDMLLSLAGGTFTVPNTVAAEIAKGNEPPIVISGTIDGLMKGIYFGPVASEIESLDFRESITIEGTKTWNDRNNQDGKRPDNITIRLLKNGTEEDSQTVTEANGWKWKFENLPKYEAGETITYSISEDPVAEYSSEVSAYDVTNSYTPATTQIQVTKIWEDGNNQDRVRPEEVTVKLFADGVDTNHTLTLTALNHWTGSFSNLDVYRAGQKIIYTVEETDPGNDYKAIVTGNADTGFTVTNVREPETTLVEGRKTWVDNNNQYDKRPASITIRLLKNGTMYASKTVTAADGWQWSFTNLPKYEAGERITYTIVEEPVAGYSSEVFGYDVTNTYVHGKPSETPNTTGTSKLPKTGEGGGHYLWFALLLVSVSGAFVGIRKIIKEREMGNSL